MEESRPIRVRLDAGGRRLRADIAQSKLSASVSQPFSCFRIGFRSNLLECQYSASRRWARAAARVTLARVDVRLAIQNGRHSGHQSSATARNTRVPGHDADADDKSSDRDLVAWPDPQRSHRLGRKSELACGQRDVLSDAGAQTHSQRTVSSLWASTSRSTQRSNAMHRVRAKPSIEFSLPPSAIGLKTCGRLDDFTPRSAPAP